MRKRALICDTFFSSDAMHVEPCCMKIFKIFRNIKSSDFNFTLFKRELDFLCFRNPYLVLKSKEFQSCLKYEASLLLSPRLFQKVWIVYINLKKLFWAFCPHCAMTANAARLK